jgi:hypothetical protein
MLADVACSYSSTVLQFYIQLICIAHSASDAGASHRSSCCFVGFDFTFARRSVESAALSYPEKGILELKAL